MRAPETTSGGDDHPGLHVQSSRGPRDQATVIVARDRIDVFVAADVGVQVLGVGAKVGDDLITCRVALAIAGERLSGQC
jgi:hypothetical protein